MIPSYQNIHFNNIIQVIISHQIRIMDRCSTLLWIDKWMDAWMANYIIDIYVQLYPEWVDDKLYHGCMVTCIMKGCMCESKNFKLYHGWIVNCNMDGWMHELPCWSVLWCSSIQWDNYFIFLHMFILLYYPKDIEK